MIKYLHFPLPTPLYYPGASNMTIKTLCPDTGRILGAQIVGFEGSR